MLIMVASTLRTRWVTLIGTFVALALGVATMATMGLGLAATAHAPDPDRDREAVITLNALLGTSGGVTAFVSVFVVASTFAFAVAQRRREIGLLRMAGATPRQVRRMLFTEAAAVGVLASAAGCALGAILAPRLATLLVDEGLAPAWFAIGDDRWPYHLAFWIGLLVALAGVTAATFRAGRIRPVEALREAAVDSRPMTAGRWVFGVGLLATALGLLAWRLAANPDEALHRKTYITQPMLLITAVALLAPVLVGPLIRMVALPGATGMLVRENAAAGLRRTAAVAAPVLVTVALAGSLLGATATIGQAKATQRYAQVEADVTDSIARVRAVPGAEVTTSRSTAVHTDANPPANRSTRIGLLLLLGIALIYTGIALANTMIMATTDRVRELAVLRLAGATRRQILVMVAVEALVVVAVGAVLGVAVAVVNLAGIWAALAALSVWSAIVLPWAALAQILLACAIVAVAAAVLPAFVALRSRHGAAE